MSGSDEAGGFGGTDPRLLLERDWDEADFRWERLTEAALGCWLGGERDAAAKGWSDALLLARQNFEADDPRLAASLTALACARIADGERPLAEKQLREALLIWDRALGAGSASGPQIAGERRSRSSMYHFSLESRFAGGYDRHVEARHADALPELLPALARREHREGAREDHLAHGGQEGMHADIVQVGIFSGGVVFNANAQLPGGVGGKIVNRLDLLPAVNNGAALFTLSCH